MVRGRVTVETLPDDVLLDIFEFYVSDGVPKPTLALQYNEYQWYPLVHVCQRWRYLVFASPHRLDLCLECTDSTPVSVREKLDIWPPLPIRILSESANLGDNIIAVLEHPDRIREIRLWRTHSPLDRLVAMMQEPFPQLETLQLTVVVQNDEAVPALPITFLGGSASRLRSLYLDGIPFPTLPRLLLSCNDLVHLILSQIPHSGYISPDTMATSISTLTRLESLLMGFSVRLFDSPASLPVRRTGHPPSLKRAVLPALIQFWFFGGNEYLEDLVARINAPFLHAVDITFFNQPIFDIQQLTQFIGHAPMLTSYDQAKIDFKSHAISIHCSSVEEISGYLKLDITGISGDAQVSSMAQICNRFSFLMSRIERLHIYARYRLLTISEVNMVNPEWLELFYPFTAVQALYLPHLFRSPIVSALQGLSEESVTDILPALVNLYLEVEGYQASAPGLQDVEPFIAARQRSGYPVAVHHWAR